MHLAKAVTTATIALAMVLATAGVAPAKASAPGDAAQGAIKAQSYPTPLSTGGTGDDNQQGGSGDDVQIGDPPGPLACPIFRSALNRDGLQTQQMSSAFPALTALLLATGGAVQAALIAAQQSSACRV